MHAPLSFISYWPELDHLASTGCSWAWEMYSLYLVPVCPAHIILVWKKQKPISGENQLPLLQWVPWWQLKTLLVLWEKARVGWFKRIALKHVYCHMWNRLPVQVWCMRQGAPSWCTGMTLRDGMEREVGGGFRMRNTCTPMADSCECMAKQIQYCKVISF